MTPPPLTNSPAEQRAKDEEHLRLLSIFHYIMAAIGAVFACFPLIHVAMGVVFMVQPEMVKESEGAAPPAWFGLLFVVMGSVFVLMGWAAAVCTFISGRHLAKRRKRMFSFVVAAILCLFAPLGTLLGVFTLIVLSRESVQQLYREAGNA